MILFSCSTQVGFLDLRNLVLILNSFRSCCICLEFGSSSVPLVFDLPLNLYYEFGLITQIHMIDS
jgi:hypothetical protein